MYWNNWDMNIKDMMAAMLAIVPLFDPPFSLLPALNLFLTQAINKS